MFTNLMNNEEKEKFLELVYKIANVDGTYAKEEEELINNYKIEFGLDEVKDTATLEALVTYFNNKTPELKKIVLFELYGMIMADGNIANKEQDILDIIKRSFHLEDSVYESIISVADELQKVYDKIYDVLF